MLTFALVAANRAPAMSFYSDPGLSNPTSYSFTAQHDGNVVAWFAGQSAGYTSVLGLTVNGVDSGVRGLNNHATPLGGALDFGRVGAGSALTFYIDVLTTGDRFFSNPALNADGQQHIWSTPYAGGEFQIPAGLFVGFEDLRGGGDRDYDDLSFVFTNVGAKNVVPEPATWMMLIAGFGLVGLAIRRRRRHVVAE
jgi:hypothetical protein